MRRWRPSFAWAPGAVLNADMTFVTRREAQDAPPRVKDLEVIGQATGYLAAERRVDLLAARQLLRAAAVRAGLPEVDVARAVLRRPQ
jgi:hypothetical protein